MGIKKMLVVAMTSAMMMTALPAAVMADSTGWRVNDDDGWRYYTSDSDYVKDNWKKINGNWYYFDEDGYAVQDSWALVDGDLYHFNSSGAMESGKWVDCGEHDVHWWMEPGNYAQWQREYMNKRDKRYIGSDGVAYTGWHQIDGDWYYFYTVEDADNNYDHDYSIVGLMVYGDFTDWSDESYYNFDSEGKMRHDCWYQGVYDEWFYFGSDGRAYSGWHQINGRWYLFSGDDWTPNSMARGMRETYDNGYELWYFGEDGSMKTGWISMPETDYDKETGEYTVVGTRWYYASPNGSLYRRKWLNSNGKWYYFDNYAKMVADVEDFYINGKFYDFDSNGVCTNANNPDKLNGWYLVTREKTDTYISGEYWTYAINGVEYQDRWLNSNGSWYYFATSRNVNDEILGSYMVCDEEDYLIDGKFYSFDENGKCLNPDTAVADPEKYGWVQEKIYGKEIGWFYYGADGKKYCNKWLQSNGKWYYFGYDGVMATGKTYVSGNGSDENMYYFDENGAMVTGWCNTKKYESDLGRWVYSDSDGALYESRWFKYNGSWYYFNKLGYMVENAEVKIDGKYYTFDENGVCLNPYDGRVDKLILIMENSFS